MVEKMFTRKRSYLLFVKYRFQLIFVVAGQLVTCCCVLDIFDNLLYTLNTNFDTLQI